MPITPATGDASTTTVDRLRQRFESGPSLSAKLPETMRAIISEVSAQFIERDEVVHALVVAMLARKHSLLLGPPGTAKSELAREIASRIDASIYWEMLLSKFTDPTSIFGPIDIAALTQNEYRQILKGRATEAHIAFIDEIFKSSGATLNAMLAFLNEGIYHPDSGGDPVQCALLAAITASNELPEDEDLSAIYDRLLVRINVDYIEKPEGFQRLLTLGASGRAAAKRTTIDMADFRHAIFTEIPQLKLPEPVMQLIAELRTTLLREAGLKPSDRRWASSVRLLQASAWLAGRDEIAGSDLLLLRHVLWDHPNDYEPVYDAILELVDPNTKELRGLLGDLRSLRNEFDALRDDGASADTRMTFCSKEANRKLTQARKRLATMRKEAREENRPLDAIAAAIDEFETIGAHIYREGLGVSDGPKVTDRDAE